jgi:uncharacterized protein
MKIQVDDIKASPKALDYDEDVVELNARLASGVQDYRLPHDLAVSVSFYRAGLDLFFEGTARGQVQGRCARCAEDYVFFLDAPFAAVLTPRAAAGTEGSQLSAEDLAFGFYEGKEVDLTPLVHEQTILALPTRPLCREDCRGLCPRCGVNLNNAACGCAAAAPAPRLAVLHALVRGK